LIARNDAPVCGVLDREPCRDWRLFETAWFGGGQRQACAFVSLEPVSVSYHEIDGQYDRLRNFTVNLFLINEIIIFIINFDPMRPWWYIE
jgi:hypothetical protein